MAQSTQPVMEGQLASANRPAGGRLARLSGLILLIVGLAALLTPTMQRMHVWWTASYSYTHGYLVVLICAWLFIELLRQRSHLRISPSLAGAVVFGGTCLLFSLAVVLSIDSLQHLLLPVLIMATVWAAGGFDLVRIAVAPVATLYFAMPIWDVLNGPLQSLTTFVVGLPLALHGFPVVIEGFDISVPAGQFHVADGCSGLHYLLVAAIIGGFLAVTDGRSAMARIKIVGLALLMGFVTNWVRVYTLILVGQYTDMQHYLIAEDHYFYGWVLFGVAMAAFFRVSRRWTRRRGGAMPPVQIAPGGRHALTLALMGGLALSAAALVLASTRAPVDTARWVPSVGPRVAVYQAGIGSWRPIQDERAAVTEGAAVLNATRFEWLLAVYPVQGPTLDITASTNRPWGTGWSVADAPSQHAGFRVAEITAELGARRLVAWRQRVAGEAIIGTLAAKRAQLEGLVTGRRDADFLAISVDCDGNCSDARARFVTAAEQWFNQVEFVAASTP